MEDLVGRYGERAILRDALESPSPELIAIYGRRRIGKTFLIRRFFGSSVAFELTGSHAGDMSAQLQAFAVSLTRATGAPDSLATPSNWMEAFQRLETHLRARLSARGPKVVVFLDELPWLATRRSGFLPAFEHFWNAWASAQPRLIVVICGSAASWMLRRVVSQRGGLYNRVTRRIRLSPFTLAETEEYLRARRVELGRYQTLELTMAFGGVPHYLSQARPGRSAAQSIDRACFADDGPLQDELRHLYAALFEHASRHEAVVRALARQRRGLDRSELLDAAGLPTGGSATTILNELEESGFVLRAPQLGRAQRDALFRLADEYSLFYLSWIERHRGTADGAWLKKRASPRFRAWSGLAFESICLKHVAQIKQGLGIAAVETEDAAWSHRPTSAADEGAQIDLVIDRADRSINLCEMKFAESEFVIDKAYARDLERKREVFRHVTGTKKALFLALVTTHGVRNNEHAQRLGVQSVTMDALFGARP
jgi:hypothetical protein